MKYRRKPLFLIILCLSLLFLPGCVSFDSAPGVPPGSAPVFTPGPGYDLLDAYNACQKDDACYDRYINASSSGSFDTQVRKFKDNRGSIRYHARGHNKDDTSFITYGEYPRYQKVNESPPPYCTLTLSYDAEGRLTEAVFKQ